MDRIKLGIVTIMSYNMCNYGNVLQAYALNSFMRKKYDYDAYTIELSFQKRYITSTPLYCIKALKKRLKSSSTSGQKRCDDNKVKKFKEFVDEYIPVERFDDFDCIKRSGYNIFIVGADVVWHQEHAFINSLMFLDFDMTYNPVKVAYAASFGNEYIPNENKNKIRKCLKQFYGVAVREKSSVDLLKSIGVNNAISVLDPVFLLSETEWSFISKSPFNGFYDLKPYCFIYLLSPQSFEIEFINEFLKKNQFEGIVVTYANNSYSGLEFTNKYHFYDNISPQEWLWLINHSECVITDSFHALAFSAIFKKNFFAMDRGKMMSRIYAFLEMINAQDALVQRNFNELIFEHNINMDEINKILNIQKKGIDKLFK